MKLEDIRYLPISFFRWGVYGTSLLGIVIAFFLYPTLARNYYRSEADAELLIAFFRGMLLPIHILLCVPYWFGVPTLVQTQSRGKRACWAILVLLFPVAFNLVLLLQELGESGPLAPVGVTAIVVLLSLGLSFVFVILPDAQ